MRRFASNGPATLLVLLLLGPALAGCLGEEPAATQASSPNSPEPGRPRGGGGPTAPAQEEGPATNATAPRVVSQSGSFLAALGNPAAIGPQAVPQTRVQGSEPFVADAQTTDAHLVVDFYYRSAPLGLAFRVVDPEGREEIVAAPDGSGIPPDPAATRHAQARFDAAPGAWSFDPHVYQARAQAEWTFVVSFFRQEPPEDYVAEPPA